MKQNPAAILVIDDEPGVTSVFRLILSRSGFKVHVAHDGETGLSVAEQEHPSLIFCDERMPRLDGYGTLKKLKANRRTADIPVVMMGGTNERGLRDWREEGAASFLGKPFQVPSLLALIRRRLADEPTPAR